MRNIKANFTKQAKDMFKNTGVLVMFIVFPAVTLIMTVFVPIPMNELNCLMNRVSYRSREKTIERLIVMDGKIHNISLFQSRIMLRNIPMISSFIDTVSALFITIARSIASMTEGISYLLGTLTPSSTGNVPISAIIRCASGEMR